jgi:hypothetical protein
MTHLCSLTNAQLAARGASLRAQSCALRQQMFELRTHAIATGERVAELIVTSQELRRMSDAALARGWWASLG